MRSRLARPLLYAGTVAVVLGLGKVHAAEVGHYDFTGSSRFAWSLTYAALLCVAAYSGGLPDLRGSRRGAVVASAIAGPGAAMAMSAVQLVGGAALLPRFVVLGSVIAVLPVWLGCVRLSAGGRQRAEERERVVLVGGRDDAETLRDELWEAEKPAALVGALRVEEAAPDGRVATAGPLVDLVTRSGASLIVLSREAQAHDAVVAQAAALHESGVRVRTLALFYEEWLGKLPLGELERVSLMFDIGELHRARYGRVKRLLDVCMALPLALVFAAVVPVVLLANRFWNRGPLFYRQERTGKHGRTFSIWKFRTMSDDPTGGTAWTSEDDPRITPFGRILRVTHIDEVPQVVNLLRGDVSFVGPRPEQPSYVAELREKLPFYDVRHLIRPGLTGWAQVKYGYAGSTADALEKLQYEFFYLRRQGLALDLRIVGRTLRSVIGRAGR